MTDIAKAFERLKEEMFFVYRGVLFERTACGFLHNGILVRDHHEMDLLIDEGLVALNDSLNNGKQQNHHEIK